MAVLLLLRVAEHRAVVCPGQGDQRAQEEKQAEKDAEIFAIEEKERKKKEFLQWMEDMKVERAEARRKEIEDARIGKRRRERRRRRKRG